MIESPLDWGAELSSDESATLELRIVPDSEEIGRVATAQAEVIFLEDEVGTPEDFMPPHGPVEKWTMSDDVMLKSQTGKTRQRW